MARAAESMGSRDNRHSQQMGQFSTHLRDIAAIEDLYNPLDAAAQGD